MIGKQTNLNNSYYCRHFSNRRFVIQIKRWILVFLPLFASTFASTGFVALIIQEIDRRLAILENNTPY